MVATRWRGVLAAAIGLWLAGCPSGSSTSKSKKPDAGKHDAGTDAGEEDAGSVYCPDSATDSSSLVMGLEAKGKTITGKFVEATPFPPERYNNSWVVDFVDGDGNPVTDLKFTDAQTWMPFHNHGKPASADAMSEPGRFKLMLNFNMRGYFEVRLHVSSASLGNDYIVFDYCLR